MAWSKEWLSFNSSDKITEQHLEAGKNIEPAKWAGQFLKTIADANSDILKITGVDLGAGEKVILTTFEDGAIKHTDITKEYKNKVPTHDPYTNPDSHIYYECSCGAILDPGTKSFAALNNAAMNNGWKVRWGAHSYVPYCVKCGEDIE